MSHDTQHHPVIRSIKSTCVSEDIPQAIANDIAAYAQSILEKHNLVDQNAQREEKALAIFNKHHPDLLSGVHAESMRNLARFIGKRPVSSLPKISLTASFMYGILKGEGRPVKADDIPPLSELIDILEERNVLDIEYTYVDMEDPDDEDNWIEIAKSDIPEEGKEAYSPMTGELDPDFHSKIVRRFWLGELFNEMHAKHV